MERRENSRWASSITAHNGSTHYNRKNERGLVKGLHDCIRTHAHVYDVADLLKNGTQPDPSEVRVVKSNDTCPRCRRPMWQHDHTPHKGEDGFPYLRRLCGGDLVRIDDGKPTEVVDTPLSFDAVLFLVYRNGEAKWNDSRLCTVGI